MGEWQLNLKGHPFDLLDLVERIRSEELTVIQDGDEFFLRAAAFAGITDAGEVRERGNKLIAQLNGAYAVIGGGRQPVESVEVIGVDDGGNRHAVKFVSAKVEGRSRVTARATSGGESQGQRVESDLEQVIACADGDEAAERALQVFGGLPHTWRNLFLVLDIVEEAVGGEAGLLATGWIPRLKMFKRTANSYGAVHEEARHAKTSFVPPKVPMELQEAERIISAMLREWLATRRSESESGSQ